MKLKKNLLAITTIFMLAISANSQAGRQGVNVYYGLGAGALAIKDYDIAPTGHIMLGLEEDGWGFEGFLFGSLDAGTDITDVDFSTRGTDVGLAYRSVEKGNHYYLIKYSKTNVDVTYSGGGFSGTFETSGNSISLGMGFRVSRENRIEATYSFHDNDDFNDPIHIINFTYMWGGAPYMGREF